ncbi:hypothetical protein NR756_09270 [Alloalcanivorax xenomutans]|uniref:hypothetical protein n=1 Tax=Alloalcanivorax xenomutans TaxID=1094342 RepID=UPI003A80CB70
MKSRYLELIANLLFVILFPLTLILNYVAALLSDEGLAFSNYGVLSAAASAIFLVCSMNALKVVENNKMFFLLLFLFFYCLLWSFLNYLFNRNIFIAEAFSQSLGLVALWSGLVFIGLYLDSSARWFKMVNWGAAVFALIVTLVLMGQFKSAVVYTRVLSESENTVGYQFLSRASLVVFMFSVFLCKRSGFALFFAISGLVVLFSIGARSELFSYMASLLVLSLFLALKNGLNLKIMTSALLVMILGLVVVYDYSEQLLESRHAQIFELSTSSSWKARQELSESAERLIFSSPIFGDFGGNVTSEGRGGYAHNILSSWVSYGFLGFLLFSISIFYPVFLSFHSFFKTKEYEADLYFCAAMSLCVAIAIIFSKPVFWPMPAIVWGIALRLRPVS